MWRWFGGRQGRPGVPGGETGGVGLQLRLDLRLHLAPAVAKLASQALPASPAARPAPPRGPRGTTHRVDQCMVAHHHHHPPTTTLQLSLTDVWNEVWRRRIQHPPSGAGASWCVRLETSTFCQYTPANNTSWLVQCVTHEISWHSPQSWDHQSRKLANIFSQKTEYPSVKRLVRVPPLPCSSSLKTAPPSEPPLLVM